MTVITNANLPVSNGSGDAALAHVQSNRIIGSTTIATDTIANWPANFIATTGTLLSSGFIDPTSKTDFYGHLGVGNQLIIDGYCPGNADNGNTSGQVVVIKPNTEWANLIAQGVQGTSLFPFQFNNFVEPAGGLWTISSGLVGTQTSGNVWYQGVRYSIPAVATLTFTASKDTYVDVNPTTGAYTYVPVGNFASEPPITTSCVRVAKIVSNASAITGIYQIAYNTPNGANTSKNPYKFLAYQATAMNSPNASSANIAFDTKLFDTSNNYNTSNGVFTAPVAGFYFFRTSILLTAAVARMFTSWQYNGGVFSRSADIGSSSQNYSITDCIFMRLALNDQVAVSLYTSAPSAIDVASKQTQLSGHMVSQT